ncbi:DNA-directed RNA polymerase sigma-70 factor [Flavobacterium noncentrifugens]|uniref:RNA polymerase sigma-70 factor, ECF subfamily n=1 Tax=Flavobacterium noncentrifugens TaxID=1128970 RepID=A0A1G8RKH5_9FLAO|nr:RNA polymerase sigma factor [Flavobacterium noncentrifugens]GEP49471.1 DNA-directed RNA polymerase sigma-70 factor [Flavobacterium noncentrifugens]SDJ17413.1 RNA polymerase sigma-70 factor, ECF subfamily [Flavobacterium noncentrifugens]
MDLNQLIKGCIRQNRKAQEELYQLYKKPLFSLCLKYCANEAEAEDNLHNAFIEIFTNIHKFSNIGSFEGWMKRITINKAVSSYKKSFQLLPIKDDHFDDTTVSETEMHLPLEIILNMIQQLPNQYRLVFCLYELDDYSHQEIAAMLSISENTSKSNLHRAKALLKEKIRSKNSFPNYNSGHGK